MEKNRNKPKALLKTLKLLGLSSDKANKWNISFQKDGAIQFEALENANIFKRSKLVRDIQEIWQRHAVNLLVKQPKAITWRLQATNPKTFSCQRYLKMLVKRFSLALIPGKISAKFLKDSAEVLTLPLKNIINLSIKLSTFSEDCKIAKLKPILKKVPGLILKTTDLFHLCP